MFRGAEHIFLDHPVKGVGLGKIVIVFPGYDTGYDGLVVDHVHNDYIEAFAETGTLGGLCGIAFLWLLVTGARRSFVAEQGHFHRASRRRDCCCLRDPPAQFCRFQSAHSFERVAFSASGLSGDVPAPSFRKFHPAPAHSQP